MRYGTIAIIDEIPSRIYSKNCKKLVNKPLCFKFWNADGLCEVGPSRPVRIVSECRSDPEAQLYSNKTVITCTVNAATLKRHPEESQSAKAYMNLRQLPLNLVDANGYLVLPTKVSGDLYLLNVGRIEPRIPFYTRDVLYPLGYRAVRLIGSKVLLLEIIDYLGAKPGSASDCPTFRITKLHGFQTHDPSKPMWTQTDPAIESTNIELVCSTMIRLEHILVKNSVVGAFFRIIRPYHLALSSPTWSCIRVRKLHFQ